MYDSLPPILPARGAAPELPPSNMGAHHAQDFSVAKLRQRQEREGAAVSISQAMSHRPSANPPLTSVSHYGSRQQAVTSVSHAGNARGDVNDQDQSDREASDYRRYSYIRRLIKKRQEEEAARDAGKPKGFHVGTGVSMRKTGPTGHRRRLSNLIRQKRATYRNISAKDKELFIDVVEDTLKYKRSGQPINRKDRIKMSGKFHRARKQGTISYEDYKDFKKIIKDMD